MGVAHPEKKNGELLFSPTILEVFALLGRTAFVVNGDLELLWPQAGAAPGDGAAARALATLDHCWTALESVVNGYLAEGASRPQRVAIGRDSGTVLTVVPLVQTGGRLPASARVFLVLHEEAALPAAPAGHDRPAVAFKLTPVENALADHICSGASVKQAAIRMGISYHTARKYLARIFEKTHVRRQTELVSLLLSARRVAPGRPATLSLVPPPDILPIAASG